MAEPDASDAYDVYAPPPKHPDDGTEELPNGDTIVRDALKEEDDEHEDEEADQEHFANIVDDVDQTKLAETVQDYLDLIDKDKEAYKRRDKKNAEALQRTGLGDDAPGGATFPGASRVVHPGLLEASIDGASRIIKEIFPSNGPVKEKIIGEVTPEKFKKSERKAQYMNWQCTMQIRSLRAELEQLLPQVCLSGVAYLQIYYNEQLKRPDACWIPGDEMLLPFAATNYYTAERKTRVEDITEIEYARRVKTGMYVDIDATVMSEEPEQSETQKAADKIQGKTPYDNPDGVRRIYRTNCLLDIEEDGEYKPYILSIDEHSSRAPALYRNWEKDDEKFKELNWIIEFPFVPWRGAYPIGLIQMIGGLSAATTGALRALLDSAHINNMPTALKLKGADRGGQTQQLNPTQVNEVEGSLQTDDIRKTWMSLPFNAPSPVLYQLLGFLVEAAQGVVRTTYEDIAENSTNMPVGTTQALIEQGMVVFSAIHGRMHDAMGRVLEALHLINKLYLSDEEVVEELGGLIVTRQDFEGPLDVVPVSDPNIFSEVQRTAQMQMVVARSDTHPELYQQLEVEKMLLKRTKIPDADKLLKKPPAPVELNAVNENLAMTMGRPVTVFPEQDHVAHLNTHVQYAMNPIFGSNPVIAPNFMPAVLGHIKDHLGLWFVSEVVATASATTGKPISEFISKDADTNRALDDFLAVATASVMQKATELFKGLPDVINQLRQIAQQFQPPQPMDPGQAAVKAATMQAQTQQARTQVDQAKLQQDGQKTAAQQAQDAKEAEDKKAMDMAEIEADNQRAAQADQVRLQTNTADNDTAKEIAGVEALVEHHKTNLKDGTGINPGVGP